MTLPPPHLHREVTECQAQELVGPGAGEHIISGSLLDVQLGRQRGLDAGYLRSLLQSRGVLPRSPGFRSPWWAGPRLSQ